MKKWKNFTDTHIVFDGYMNVHWPKLFGLLKEMFSNNKSDIEEISSYRQNFLDHIYKDQRRPIHLDIMK